MIYSIKHLFYLITLIFVIQGCINDDIDTQTLYLVPTLNEGTKYNCDLTEDMLITNNNDTIVATSDTSKYYLIYEKQVDNRFNYLFEILYLDTNEFKYNMLEPIRNIEFQIQIDSIGNIISINSKENRLLFDNQLKNNLFQKTNYFFNILYNYYWQDINLSNSIVDTISIPLLNGLSVKGVTETIVNDYVQNKYLEVIFRTSHKSSNFSFLNEFEYHIDLSKMLIMEIRTKMESIEKEKITVRKALYNFKYYDE